MESRSRRAADGGENPHAKTETGDSSAGAEKRIFVDTPRFLAGSELRIRDRPKGEKIPPTTYAGVRIRGGQKSFGPGAV